jgi:hypothetical protein
VLDAGSTLELPSRIDSAIHVLGQVPENNRPSFVLASSAIVQ